VLALAVVAVVASLVAVPSHPASADPLASAQAQAAALSAKLNGEQQQIADLTGEYNAAAYHLSQLDAQISQTQAGLAKDRAAVNADESQLRSQAVADYMSSGTSNQLTEMFSSGSSNAASERSEYTAIATGNVTTTVDNLNTAQTHLQSEQSALQQQRSQAAATAASFSTAQSEATALAGQYQSQLNSANANVHAIVLAQQAAAQAAAAQAAQARLAAAQAAQRAQQAAAQQAAAQQSQATTGSGSSGGSSGGAPVTVSYAPLPPLAPGAAGAVQAAEREVGVPYVWGGTTPAGFDCSGLVMWAYAQVGISLPHYSGAQYDDTTQIPLADIQPGDLLFYGPGGDQHVAMYVGGGMMIEAPYTGATVHITPIRTGAGFVGVGRVN